MFANHRLAAEGRLLLAVGSGDGLDVHEETVRRWAREGAIPAAKLGNRSGFRFKREDLDRFLEGRRNVDCQ
jgi:excisionase family DNA binding protein